nr:hypothetical protein Hi04_10k_c3120_00033 [uncultured bacterium]
MNGRLTFAATLSLLLVAGTASALQPWLQDRRFAEGQGITAGRFVLHPGLSTDFGYDSNYYLRADNENPQSALRFRVTPALTFNTVTGHETHGSSTAAGSTPMVVADGRAFFAYSRMFGSSDEIKQNKQTFDAGVGGRMDIAPTRPIGADLYVDFLRNGEPSNVAGTGQTFDRGSITGGGGLSWRPGGGLFVWRAGYEAQYNYFDDKPYSADYNNVQQSIITNGRWKILPRSAVLYDARYTFIRYQSQNSPQPNGDQLQARLGFSGLVTSRISFLIRAGWNSTYYESTGNGSATKSATPAKNYDGPVGQAELGFFLNPAPEDSNVVVTGISAIKIGAEHQLGNSYLGAFYTQDRGYLNLDMFLAGLVVAQLQGGFSHYSYPQVDTTLNPLGFTQNHIDAMFFTEYRFNDNLGVNGTLMYDQSIGEGPYPQGVLLQRGATPQEDRYDNLEYKRFQAYLGLRLFW